jgi:hypothetical protein
MSVNHKAIKFVQDVNFVTRKIGQETIIVPITNRVAGLDSVYTLNETASLIWQQLANPCTLTELIDLVSSQYEVTISQAETDILSILDKLTQAGLIHQKTAD